MPSRIRPCSVSAAIMAEPLSSEQRAGQSALLKRLAQAVTEFLGAFGQIPLGMAAQARMIIEDAQQERVSPLAVGQEHPQRAVVKVQMPEPVDILALVAANLAGLEAVPRPLARPDCAPGRGGDV